MASAPAAAAGGGAGAAGSRGPYFQHLQAPLTMGSAMLTALLTRRVLTLGRGFIFRHQRDTALQEHVPSWGKGYVVPHALSFPFHVGVPLKNDEITPTQQGMGVHDSLAPVSCQAPSEGAAAPSVHAVSPGGGLAAAPPAAACIFDLSFGVALSHDSMAPCGSECLPQGVDNETQASEQCIFDLFVSPSQTTAITRSPDVIISTKEAVTQNPKAKHKRSHRKVMSISLPPKQKPTVLPLPKHKPFYAPLVLQAKKKTAPLTPLKKAIHDPKQSTASVAIQVVSFRQEKKKEVENNKIDEKDPATMATAEPVAAEPLPVTEPPAVAEPLPTEPSSALIVATSALQMLMPPTPDETVKRTIGAKKTRKNKEKGLQVIANVPTPLELSELKDLKDLQTMLTTNSRAVHWRSLISECYQAILSDRGRYYLYDGTTFLPNDQHGPTLENIMKWEKPITNMPITQVWSPAFLQGCMTRENWTIDCFWLADKHSRTIELSAVRLFEVFLTDMKEAGLITQRTFMVRDTPFYVTTDSPKEGVHGGSLSPARRQAITKERRDKKLICFPLRQLCSLCLWPCWSHRIFEEYKALLKRRENSKEPENIDLLGIKRDLYDSPTPCHFFIKRLYMT